MYSKYRLKNGVYLVTGASQGAILDTNTGLVYSINGQACKVCAYQVKDELYWQTLVSMGVAEQAESIMNQELPKSIGDDHLRFIWLEIVTNKCNLRCIHCYTDSMPQYNRRDSFKAESFADHNQARHRMSYKDWLKVIEQASELGCKACQFIGGEPLLYRGENGETVFELAGFAKKVGYSSIEIFTNATLLTPDKIRTIKDLDVKVAVSLYSNDPAVHDGITRTSGSYSKTLNSLELLKKYGVKTRVETIVMKANQDSIESTIAFIRQMGLHGRKPDPVRPNGRGVKSVVQLDDVHLTKYGYTLNPNFKASEEKIARYRTSHPCLHGKMVITEFGDILPCVFAREHSLGNCLPNNDIAEIIHDAQLQKLWHATKDDVMVCKDCEFRYVCFDCRPLAETVSQGRIDFQTAPYPRCTYNPYTGQWGDGVWMVDQRGEPYYDISMAAEIQQARQLVQRS